MVEGRLFEARMVDGPSTPRVTLMGEFDFACVGEAEAAVALAIDGGHERVVIDIDQLDFIDSGAIAFLYGLTRREDAAFGFTRGSGRVAKMLHLVGVDEVLHYDGESTSSRPEHLSRYG